MQAMISADSSMKQAKVQGSVAVQMEGKASVLESEIKMDQGRGVSTEKKEEELANVQSKAQAATASQMSALADANDIAKEASEKEDTTQTDENKKDKTDKTKQEADNKELEVVAVEATQTATQSIPYTSIDVRL